MIFFARSLQECPPEFRIAFKGMARQKRRACDVAPEEARPEAFVLSAGAFEAPARPTRAASAISPQNLQRPRLVWVAPARSTCRLIQQRPAASLPLKSLGRRPDISGESEAAWFLSSAPHWPQRPGADSRFIRPYATGVLRAPPSACACARSTGARCLETRPFIQLWKHPESSAAAVMNLAPAVPAARSRRTLPLTDRAQAPFDCAHRRSRVDALRSGCLRLLCALPRTRRF